MALILRLIKFKRFGLILSVTSLMVIISGLITIQPARAETTWIAQAGELFIEESISINQFLPRDLTIVQGDTVVWNRRVFHTITFLSGEERPAWLEPLGDGRLGVNPDVGFPSGQIFREEEEQIFIASWGRDRLGMIEAPEGPMIINVNNEYDGTGYYNSGAPFNPNFLPRPVPVKFTQPGVYELVCLVHPAMKATVTVLQEGFTSPDSQEQVDIRLEQELQVLLEEARSFVKKEEVKVTKNSNYTTRYGISTGVFQDDVEFAQFIPQPNLEIFVGDTVKWDWSLAGDTPHTVSFLSGGETPEYFLVERKVFADGSLNVRDPPTIALNATVGNKAGGSIYSGKDFFNSGVIFGEGAPPGFDRRTNYSLTFDTEGSFPYLCLMHGTSMAGTITVKPAPPRPNGVAIVSDDQSRSDAITYTINNYPAPSAGTEYVGWMISDDGSKELNTGILEIDEAGNVVHLFDSTNPRYTGQNLVREYDKVVITEEPFGTDPDSSTGPVLFSHQIPSGTIFHLRHLLSDWPAESGTGVLENILKQMQLALDQANLANDQSSLEYTLKHLENVVNIIEGPNGENAGDVDRNGAVKNLGDGIGLIKHVNDRQHVMFASSEAPEDEVVNKHALEVKITGQNIEDRVILARDEALLAVSIAFDESDISADEIDKFDLIKLAVAGVIGYLDVGMKGTDFDADGKIEMIEKEGGALQTYIGAQLMATYTLQAGPLPPPAPKPVPTPTPIPPTPTPVPTPMPTPMPPQSVGDDSIPTIMNLVFIMSILLLASGAVITLRTRRKS